MAESLLVACPACRTLNRVPTQRLIDGERGKCGKCGAPLFDGHPVALDAAGFEAHAVKSDLPVLVDFWAPWCGPCRAMAPQFEKAAQRLEPKVRMAKINTEEQQELAVRFGIQGIPTIVLLHRGREVARRSGLLDAAGIERWVGESLDGA